MNILTNHLGYSAHGPKRAVLQCAPGEIPGPCTLLGPDGPAAVLAPVRVGPVARWNCGEFWTVDFSHIEAGGEYRLQAESAQGPARSHAFVISARRLTMRMINAVGYYFKAQRDTGEWLAADRALPFRGPRPGTVDAHGGWFDATGDYGIHLSHLSHSTWYNPQQVPLSAYVFFAVHDLLGESGNDQYTMVRRRALDEGYWGADFLMRMRAPSGSFYRSVGRRDALESATGTRALDFEYRASSDQFSPTAATAGEETITDENYECSLRSGGGLAIAALAAAGRHYYPGTGYTQGEYLQAAKAAWRHLAAHNDRYTNDGRWNLIDETCALVALTELEQATGEYEYRREARAMARRIIGRAVPADAGRRLEIAPGRPYHAASDEGLPVVALLRYAAREPDPDAAAAARRTAEEVMRHTLAVTDAVPNPFGYPRMEVPDGPGIRAQFFFPHDSTAAPWWQGDNARLASLSAAAQLVARVTADPALAARCRLLAQQTLDWIMGCNPFDACMIEGYGHHNIAYFFENRYDFLNCPGGICNGITSGLEDEEGIAFVTAPTPAVTDNWRWAEQWLPHASWYLWAMALKGE